MLQLDAFFVVRWIPYLNAWHVPVDISVAAEPSVSLSRMIDASKFSIDCIKLLASRRKGRIDCNPKGGFVSGFVFTVQKRQATQQLGLCDRDYFCI